jgi:hypothetical protein
MEGSQAKQIGGERIVVIAMKAPDVSTDLIRVFYPVNSKFPIQTLIRTL